MNADQLKQEILMLRRQRAGIHVLVTRLAHERHTTLLKMDKEINEKTDIVLDLDVRIAEHVSAYAKMQAAENSDTPHRPLGPNGALMQVHKTTAYVYDKFMADGVFRVKDHNPLDRTHGRHLQMQACDLIIRAGLAYAVGDRKGDYSIRKQPQQNPVDMPSPSCRVDV